MPSSTTFNALCIVLMIAIILLMIWLAMPHPQDDAVDEHKLYMGDQSNLDGVARVVANEWFNRCSHGEMFAFMDHHGIGDNDTDEDIIDAKVREILSIAEPLAH